MFRGKAQHTDTHLKKRVLVILFGFGIVASVRANAQGPVYVPSAESCLSVRNGNDGSRKFYNVCSRKIFASVFVRSGLSFDGYYNNGHMDDLPPNEGEYKYFACPSNATPEDSETSEDVTFDTGSYKCHKTGT